MFNPASLSVLRDQAWDAAVRMLRRWTGFPRRALPRPEGVIFNPALLSVLESKLCDDLLAENQRLRAEKEELRAKIKFLLDTEQISVDVVGPGGVCATGTQSRRKCLEADYAHVYLGEAEGAACTLGSLLDSRLVLRNTGEPNRPDVVKEVADLADKGFMGVVGGNLVVVLAGGEERVFRSLLFRPLVSQLPDDVPITEAGDVAQWSDCSPEWLATNRDAPVEVTCAYLSLPHLFRMYASDDEGEDGAD